jgi:hypothetical protein
MTLVERLAALDEERFIETGKKRGAIALGFDEQEVRAAYRRSPREAQAMLSARPDYCRTLVGAPRDSAVSAPPALRAEDLPANQAHRGPTSADLDAALRRGIPVGGKLVPVDPAKMRANLHSQGLDDAAIDRELARMAGVPATSSESSRPIPMPNALPRIG